MPRNRTACSLTIFTYFWQQTFPHLWTSASTVMKHCTTVRQIIFMKKTVVLFFLFSCLIAPGSGFASKKTKWKPVETPVPMEQIIGGSSINDFWTWDINRNIFHYYAGRWKTYPLKKLFAPVTIRSYQPVWLQKNRLIVLLTDLDWKTHITEINDGKIIRYGWVSANALTEIVPFNGHIYALGNFGSIHKLVDGKWKKIVTPIQSHIFSAAADQRGTLWLGTRRQGIFAYKHNKFKQYKLPGDSWNEAITGLSMKEDTLFIRTSKGNTFKMAGDTFVVAKAAPSLFNTAITLMSNGYYKVVSRNNKAWYIPYFYQLLSFKSLQDGHAFILTQNHQLLYDEQVSANFFLDFSSIRGLEGPKYSLPTIIRRSHSIYSKLSPGITVADFNHDHHQDILLFNVLDKRRPFLFINNRSQYFNNLSGSYGLNAFGFNSHFTYAIDLNGDDTPEIISPDFRNKGFLNILEKTAGTYRLSASIPIPREYADNPVQALNFYDIDRDGDLDIVLVFGYSKQGKGNILFLKNNGYGNFEAPDTSHTSLFKGWNVQAIFADFNNDGFDDIFVSRNWGANVIFFRDKSGWSMQRMKTSKHFRSQQRKHETVVFDYDNDGDMDMVTLAERPFIRLLQNNGHGVFTDVTAMSGLDTLNTAPINGHITAGDFDNNGYIDLFITTKQKKNWKNHLFLNGPEHRFTDNTKRMGMAGTPVEFAATLDVDNDGDLDLYAYRQGSNVLWINNLDSNNYLTLKLRGIRANPAAIGTKIWLYEAGHFNNRHYLAGYRQTGSNLMNQNYQNSNIVHFGVKPSQRYDIKLAFPGGKTITLKNVSPGQRLEVAELNAPVSWLYTWDNRIYLLLNNKTFLSYFAIVSAGLFILLLTIYYGTRKFNWDVKLTTIIVSANLIVFALLLLALNAARPPLKYYLPLGVILLGSLGPAGFFLWIKKFSNWKSHKENENDLFQALLNFSHGAWAASNMNSIQLFFENLSASDLNDPDLKKALNKRKETFMHLTLPVMEKIISLAGDQESNADLASDMKRYKTFIVRKMQHNEMTADRIEKEKLITAILKLRELLAKLKNRVFAGHSCYPSAVLNKLKIELTPLMEKNQIHLKVIQRLPDDYPALTEPAALADILDNCIRNSLKAMAKTKDKQLTIKLLKGDPRIYIEVSDNGCGIPEQNFEKIFENGFSTTHSTGYGLYQAREVLSKYGGRIYVKSSVPYGKTTMVIELQKGSSK